MAQPDVPESQAPQDIYDDTMAQPQQDVYDDTMAQPQQEVYDDTMAAQPSQAYEDAMPAQQEGLYQVRWIVVWHEWTIDSEQLVLPFYNFVITKT